MFSRYVFLCGMLGVNVFVRGYILVSLIERRVVSCMLVVADISIFGEFRVLVAFDSRHVGRFKVVYMWI